MLKVAEQEDWTKMYVYQTEVRADLFGVLVEYLSECEHGDGITSCTEVSPDTVDDVEAWKEKRKWILLADFADYIIASFNSD